MDHRHRHRRREGAGCAAVARGGFVKALVCDKELAQSLLEVQATKESKVAG